MNSLELKFFLVTRAYEDGETKKSIEQDTQLQEINSLKNDKRELQNLLDQRERQIDGIELLLINC